MSHGRRRLAAIMFTDMVGYTTLGQRNEFLSLALVEEERRLIGRVLQKHGGREVKTMGDALLVEFPSALDAVRCAYDIQRATREFNIPLSEDRRVHLRVGIHLGDVVESKGDISGDAVNVASRIEPLAGDGGVCLTQQVFDQVRNKFEVPLVSLGSKSLKNVDAPLVVYRMLMPWKREGSDAMVGLDTKRVAILPFANMSPDPNDSYFADGITEEVISTLSGVSGLSVISRTSVIGYRGSTKKVKEIGHELEAGSILEGSFRKAGSRIRVTTQLIDVSSDKHVWAQSYDRNLDDVFAVQTDIAKQVADALRVKILAPEIDRIDKKPTENTDAYALYLRGRYHWNKRHPEDVKKAIKYFEQAVEEDPKFALGYAGLADGYEVLANLWTTDTTAYREKANQASKRALELDESLAEAHASRGLALMLYRLREAEDEFRRAIELKPSYASAHHWYSIILRSQMRLDEAFDEINKALQLDPFSQITNLNHARCYMATRDYGKALEICKRTAELDPSYEEAHFLMFLLYGLMKGFDEMRREAKIITELSKDRYPFTATQLEAGMAYFKEDKETVRRLLPDLEAGMDQPGSDAYLVAILHFFLGENDKGFEWLERSVSRQEFAPLVLRMDEPFDGIRSDPRYLNLIKRLGLE